MIKINNNKKTLDVVVDFNVWLKSKPKTIKSTRLYGGRSRYPFGVYDDDDDDYYLGSLQSFWDDPYPTDDLPFDDDEPTLKELTERYGGICIDDISTPSKKKRRGKKHKTKTIRLDNPRIKGISKKSKKHKDNAYQCDYTASPSDCYSRLHEERAIYFYSDIKDQSSWMLFKTAYELDSYLSDIKIDVPNSSIIKLFDNYETHCCIDPKSIDSGFIELAVAESYGHLRWEYDPTFSQDSDNSDLPF